MIREWDDLRVFLAVARGGRYAAAAPHLNMVTATVRRRLDALEARIGEALLTPEGGGVTPTATGRALIPLAEALEAAARGFVLAAEGERRLAAGVVRVAASEIIAQYFLTPLFARLRRSHPDIAISLIAQNGPAPFDAETADVGLVLVEPSGDAVAASVVGEFEMGLFGTTDLLDQVGRPTRPEHLRHLPMAGAPGHPLTWNIYGRLGLREGDLTFRVHTDSFAGQFDAVRSGMAIGACNAAFAAQFADIERVLPNYRYNGAMWLAMDANQADVLRVRLVRDAIAEAVAASLMAVAPPGTRP